MIYKFYNEAHRQRGLLEDLSDVFKILLLVGLLLFAATLD